MTGDEQTYIKQGDYYFINTEHDGLYDIKFNIQKRNVNIRQGPMILYPSMKPMFITIMKNSKSISE